MQNIEFDIPKRKPPTQISGIYVALAPQCKVFALAMYISFLLMSISFTLGPVFQWNMGLKVLKGLTLHDGGPLPYNGINGGPLLQHVGINYCEKKI